MSELLEEHATAIARRVRRPRDREPVIEALRDEKTGAFRDIRDVMVFAAALGFERDRFLPVTDYHRDAIRWDTFTRHPYAEELVGLIAVAHSEDQGVVAADRQPEQLVIFENYANGGLAVLTEALAMQPNQSALQVVLDLCQQTRAESRGIGAIIDIAGGGEL